MGVRVGVRVTGIVSSPSGTPSLTRLGVLPPLAALTTLLSAEPVTAAAAW